MPTQEEIDRMVADTRGSISQPPSVTNATNAVQPAVVAPGAGSNDIGTAIDESVNPVASQNDLDAIAQANAQYAPPPAATLTPQTAVGNQGNASIMPTLNQPINVGTSSGQITGSHGVYVDPGFVAPWGVMMEQQKQKQVAQQEQDKLANQSAREAHAAKKDKDKAFKFDRPKGPIADDPHFQADLDKQAKGILDRNIDIAKEIGGKDWQILLKSDTDVGRKFRSEMDGLNIIARNANYMTEKFGEIEAGLKDGSTYYSPGVKEAYQDYQSASGESFKDGNAESLGGIRQKLRKLDGELELNRFIKDSGMLTKVIGEVTGGTSVSNFGDFMKLRTSNRTSYDENINAMVKNIMQAKGPDSDYSEADIRNALEGHLKNESKSKTTLKANPEDSKSGLKMEDKDIKIQKGGTSVVIKNPDAKGEDSETTFNVESRMPVNTIKGGLKSEGLKIVTDKFGGTQEVADIANVNITSFGNVVYQDETGKFGDIKYKKIATAEMEVEVPVMELNDDGEQVPSGKTTTEIRTVQIDAEEAEDFLRHNYGDKVIDTHNKENERLNSASSGENKKKAPAKQSRPERNAAKIGMKDRVADGTPKKGDTYGDFIFNGTEYVNK